MAHRHKVQYAKGGGVPPKHDAHKTVYAGKDSNVAHEAESTENKKRGGRAHKRKSGGRVPGFKAGGRLDKRARGGGVGADKSPFSSAHIPGHHKHGGAAHNPPHHKSGGHAHGHHGAGIDHRAHIKG